MNKNLSIEYIMKNYKFSLMLNREGIVSTNHVRRYETSDSFIWLINPNEVELNINALEKLDNIKNHVYEIDGIWACIIQNKLETSFRAITSIHNELPWYYTEGSNRIIANNIFLISEYLDNVELNYTAISSFLAYDFCYSGETFLNGVRKSYGGDIMYFYNNSIRIVGCDLEKWLGFDGSISNRDMILEAFLHSVDKSLQGINPQITLTAGSDSRAILAAALSSGKKFSLMTGTASSVDKRDIRVAELIAKLTNKKHYKIDASKTEINKIENVIEEMALKTNAEFVPTNWIIFYKEYVLDLENLKDISRLMGYRGEFFKGFYAGFFGNVDSYLNRHGSFMNKKYNLLTNDLIREKYSFYKKLAGINVNELFYHRERDNFWVSCSMKAYISYCKLSTPFSDSKLLSLGYRFAGGIKESKLHQSAFNLLPQKIKNIPTGYNQIGRIYHHFQKKLKRQQEHDYYLKADFLQSNMNRELLSKVIESKTIESLINEYRLKRLNSDLVHKMFAVSYFHKLVS